MHNSECSIKIHTYIYIIKYSSIVGIVWLLDTAQRQVSNTCSVDILHIGNQRVFKNCDAIHLNGD